MNLPHCSHPMPTLLPTNGKHLYIILPNMAAGLWTFPLLCLGSSRLHMLLIAQCLYASVWVRTLVFTGTNEGYNRLPESVMKVAMSPES